MHRLKIPLMKDKLNVKTKRDQCWQKLFLDQQISSTEDDLKFIKEQLDIQKLEDSKRSFLI